MEKSINNLVDGIHKLSYYADFLIKIEKGVDDSIKGIFNSENYNNTFYFESVRENIYSISKKINFPLLYSVENEDLAKILDIYKNFSDIVNSKIDTINEKFNEAVFNYENYYEPVKKSFEEIDYIVEAGDTLEEYLCNFLANTFFKEKVPAAHINSDYLLVVLDSSNDENIVSYINLVKNKLKELQSFSPYTESGLEVFKKPEIKTNEVSSSDYQDELINILKRANKYDN